MTMSKAETWIVEHSIRIFLVVAMALLLAGGVAIYLIAQQERTETKVERLEPKVTQIVRATKVCTHPSPRCAKLLEIAFESCRRYPSCRAAVLVAILKPIAAPEEVMPQPSHGGQQPSPGPSNPGAPASPQPSPLPAPATPSPALEVPKLPNGKPFPGVGPPGGLPGVAGCPLEICVSVEGETE